MVLRKFGLSSNEYHIYLPTKEDNLNELLTMIFFAEYLESMKSIVACQIRFSESMVLKMLIPLLYNFYLGLLKPVNVEKVRVFSKTLNWIQTLNWKRLYQPIFEFIWLDVFLKPVQWRIQSFFGDTEFCSGFGGSCDAPKAPRIYSSKMVKIPMKCALDNLKLIETT